MVVLIGSAVVSAIVDNILYVTAMTPVVESLIASNPALARAVRCGGRWLWARLRRKRRRQKPVRTWSSGTLARNGLHIRSDVDEAFMCSMAAMSTR